MVLRLSLLAAAAAMLLAEAPAHASPAFPDALASHLALRSAPDCVLCHVGDNTNASSARQPFAVTLKAHGARAADAPSLVAALDAIAADKSDSDGDGSPDIAELAAGSNPNDPSSGANPDGGGTPTSGSDGGYRTGCGATVAPRATVGARFLPLFALVAVGAALVRRRRGRSPGA